MIRSKLSSTGNEDFYQMSYESKVDLVDNENHLTHLSNREDWNYWVIEHNETQSNSNIKLALQLSNCD